MRSNTRCKLYGLELKEGGEYQGKAFDASAIFHLDVSMAETSNKKVYGVVTRPFRGTRAQGNAIEQLAMQGLPVEVDCAFDMIATAGNKDQPPGVQLKLIEIHAVGPVKKAA